MTATAEHTTDPVTTTPKAWMVGAAWFSDAPENLVKFYELVLDLTFERRDHADGRIHWVTGAADVHIEIKANLQADGTPTPDSVSGSHGHSNIELSFQVPDARATLAKALEAGATVHQQIEELRWGTFGVVLDTDGNRLGLFTPPTAEVR